tara:strand:- start:646 stop:1425 length:780 start_codon:yes stop_codon:yes gene_type:complete
MKKIISLLIILVLAISPVLAQEELEGEGITNSEEETIKVIKLEDPGALPDSPFYGLKKFGEKVGLAFSFSEESKTEKRLEYAERRIAEAHVMNAGGKSDYVPELLSEYELIMEELVPEVAGSETVDTQSAVAEATEDHAKVLSSFYDDVPEETRGVVAHATAVSIEGNSMVVQVLDDGTAVDASGHVIELDASEEAIAAIEEARSGVAIGIAGEAIPGEAIPMPVPSDDAPSSGGGNVVGNVPEVSSEGSETGSSDDGS